MRVATCVVCGERLNVLQEKLITAEWVDATSGTLVEMQFHSACFVRWYQETASARSPAQAQQPQGPKTERPKTERPKTERPRAAGPGDEAGAPSLPPAVEPPPEAYLSAAERARLQELRSRLAERGDRGAPGSGGAGQHPEDDQQGVGEDDQPPQN